MRLLMQSVFATLALVFIPASTLTADDYTGSTEFSVTDLDIIAHQGYHFVSFPEGTISMPTGTPALPSVQMDLAIPWDAEIVGIRILNVETRDVDGKFNVPPVTAPRRLSDPFLDASPFIKDPAIYERDAYYPHACADLLSVWDLVGQRMATLVFHPIQYNPVTCKIRIATRVEFQVIWSFDAAAPEQPTFNLTEAGLAYYEGVLKKRLLNPEDLSIPPYQGSASLALPPGQYEHVIITTAALESFWSNLVDWHTRKGFPDTVVTKEYIYANYTGATNQVKIRNFVIDAHATWGTRYFLIGGDKGDSSIQVPCHERLFSTVDSDPVPNDTYYSDYNNNWVVDVHVGRFTLAGGYQIAPFIAKVLSYEKNPPSSSYGNSVLFLGFDLDSSTPGEDTKKHIKNNYIPGTISFQSEYDSESGGHLSDVIAYMNGGPNLVNHSDHCNWDRWGMGSTNHGQLMLASHVNALSNGWRLINFYTLGCLASAWDYGTSISETFMRKTGGAGVSFTGNTRYGWYNPGYYNTLSALYDIRWWHVLFTDNKYLVGETLTAHKNDYYPGDNYYKYIFTELNLLGDPAMPLWKENPATLAVNYADPINTGSQSYTVNVKKSGLNLQGALVCIWKGSEVYTYDTTNAAGNAAFTIDPATEGTLLVTATAQNALPHEGSVTVNSNGAPDLTDVNPEHGATAGGTPCTLTGSRFTTTPDTTVTFGGTLASNVFVVNSNTITCLSPAKGAGSVGITVTNSNGSDTLPNAFTYHNPPSLSSVSPDTGSTAGGTAVTLSGGDFTDQGSTTVTFGGAQAGSVQVVNATTITCTTPPHGAGAINVTVSNDFGSDTLPQGFTYQASPVITDISPVSGPAGGGTIVTITGANFPPGTGTSVTFGGNQASSVQVLNASTLICLTPSHTPGIVDVTVSNSFGSDTLDDGFTYYTSPIVSRVQPPNGPILGGTAVTIYGSNFTDTFDTTVTFNGGGAGNLNVLNANTLTCTTPAHASGPVDVAVSNSYGLGTLVNGYTYDYPPVVDAVIPADGPISGGTAVSIYGSNFTSSFSMTVEFGGSFASNVQVASYDLITCTTPAHSAGTVELGVTSINGSGSLPDAFTYHNPPDIDLVTPAFGPLGGGTPVTLDGAHFTYTADTTVTFGGEPAVDMSVVNSTTITCKTPPGGAPGPVDVRVTHSWGTDTLSDGFTYVPPPEITGVNPAVGLMQASSAITITGNYFSPSSNTELFIGGAAALNVVVVDANTITCDTPVYPVPDIVDVDLQNSNGSDNLPAGFEFIPALGNPPMNLTDRDTLNVYPGEVVRLSITGPPHAAHAVFLSLGPGPVPTAWGTMGLSFPIINLWTATLNANGYFTIPLEMTDPQVGFFNFYLHALVDDNPIIWATGGNNPNGSGSIMWGLHSTY